MYYKPGSSLGVTVDHKSDNTLINTPRAENKIFSAGLIVFIASTNGVKIGISPAASSEQLVIAPNVLPSIMSVKQVWNGRNEMKNLIIETHALFIIVNKGLKRSLSGIGSKLLAILNLLKI